MNILSELALLWLRGFTTRLWRWVEPGLQSGLARLHEPGLVLIQIRIRVKGVV